MVDILSPLRWIGGALKGVFAGAYLQDKIKQLEARVGQLTTECDDLRDQLHDARSMISKLDGELKRLTAAPYEPDQNEANVLKLLSIEWATALQLSQVLKMPWARVEFHLERLMMGSYLQTRDHMGAAVYGLAQRGRQYLVEHDLL